MNTCQPRLKGLPDLLLHILTVQLGLETSGEYEHIRSIQLFFNGTCTIETTGGGGTAHTCYVTDLVVPFAFFQRLCYDVYCVVLTHHVLVELLLHLPAQLRLQTLLTSRCKAA